MEKQKIICLLPKSPRPKKGRRGLDEKQNWFKGCQLAARLAKEHNWQILIPSSFQIPTAGYVETAFYHRILLYLWVPKNLIIPVNYGMETSQQLQAAINNAVISNRDMIVVWSSWPHRWRYPLIKSWLTIPSGIKISHKTAFGGRARPKEFFMDVAVLPVLLIIKIIRPFWQAPEKWFQKWLFSRLQASRVKGKIY